MRQMYQAYARTCNFMPFLMYFICIFQLMYERAMLYVYSNNSKKNINACHKPVHYLTIGKNSENVKLCIRGKP